MHETKEQKAARDLGVSHAHILRVRVGNTHSMCKRTTMTIALSFMVMSLIEWETSAVKIN